MTIMTEPMLSRYGTNFEKEAILKWLNKGNATCPVTGKPLGPSCLVSNKNLKWKIQCWQGTSTCHATKREEGKVVPDYGDEILAFMILPPKNFFCAVSGKIMSDPVVSKEGISFERNDILLWLEEEDICPVTGNALSPRLLIPYIKLRKEIQEWHTTSNDTFQSLAMDFSEDHQAAVWGSKKKLDSKGEEEALEGLRAKALGKRKKAFVIKETTARSA